MDKSKKTILISLIPAILTLVFVLYVLLPSFGYMEKTKTQLKIKKQELSSLKSQLESVKAYESKLSQLKELQEKLAGFDIGVPEKQELAVFLIDIDKFAKLSGVKVTGFDVRPENAVEIKNPNVENEKKKKKSKRRGKNVKQELPVDLWEIPIEIQVVGFYPEIIKFVDLMEKYQRIIITDGIIAKDYEDDEKKAFPRVKMTLFSKVYRMSEQEIEEETTNQTDSKTQQQVSQKEGK